MALVTVIRNTGIPDGTYLSPSSASTTYLTQSSASTTYLTKSSASTTYLTQASASTTYVPSSVQTGFRNAIINGGLRIWQRGTTFSATGYTADRWNVQTASGQTVSCTQQAFTAGNAITGYEPTYFLRTTWSGTPSGTFWLNQKVEDVRTFAGQTVTLSFWAKAGSATSAFTPVIEQNFGTGGSSVVTTNGTAISLTTSWKRFTQTFNIPSITGKTIGTSSYLDVRPFNGSTSVAGNAIDLWGVQLELGSSATPFEQRPYGTELSLCQRYYNILVTDNSQSPFLDGYQAASGYLTAYIAFPAMRQNPVVTPTWGASSNVTSYNAVATGNNTIWIYFRATALGRAYIYINSITLSAEL